MLVPRPGIRLARDDTLLVPFAGCAKGPLLMKMDEKIINHDTTDRKEEAHKQSMLSYLKVAL